MLTTSDMCEFFSDKWSSFRVAGKECRPYKVDSDFNIGVISFSFYTTVFSDDSETVRKAKDLFAGCIVAETFRDKYVDGVTVTMPYSIETKAQDLLKLQANYTKELAAITDRYNCSLYDIESRVTT